MKSRLILAFVVIWIGGFNIPSQVRAHGEDHYGPHRGFLRMPGAFHTELVPVGDRKLRVFLLDLHWKNPTVKDSSVELRLFREQKEESVSCQSRKKYFECFLSEEFSLKRIEKIKILAKREGTVGGEAVYPVPLKLLK